MPKDEAVNIAAGTEQQFEEDARPLETNDKDLVPIPSDAVPLEVALPCSIYIKIGDRFPRFRSQGERLNSKRVIGLSQKGAKVLYVHARVWEHFVASLEKSAGSLSEKPVERANQLRTLMIAYGTELERKLKQPKKPVFEKLRRLAENLAMIIGKDPTVGLTVLRKDGDPMVYFVNHSVNSCVYACVIAHKLRYPIDEMKTLAYATLVHDVGNLFIQKTVLHKTTELSAEEKELMNSHPRMGAELLTSLGSPTPVVLTALQHHERIDGKGYPSGLSGNQIHPFAQICAVADTYDALTSNRPFKQGISPKEAIEKMRTLEGKFESNILGAVTETAKATE